MDTKTKIISEAGDPVLLCEDNDWTILEILDKNNFYYLKNWLIENKVNLNGFYVPFNSSL